jgi:PAS domain-containing protein
VPGTDWFLLAQLDRSELYGPAVIEALWIVLAGSLAIFVSAAGLYQAHQRRQLAQSAQAQQAQAERLHALDLLAAVADNAEDAVFAKDVDGRYTLSNRAAARHMDRTVEEVIGRDDRALLPPDRATMLIESDRQGPAAGPLITQEMRVQTAQGRTGPADDQGTAARRLRRGGGCVRHLARHHGDEARRAGAAGAEGKAGRIAAHCPRGELAGRPAGAAPHLVRRDLSAARADARRQGPHPQAGAVHPGTAGPGRAARLDAAHGRRAARRRHRVRRDAA